MRPTTIPFAVLALGLAGGVWLWDNSGGSIYQTGLAFLCLTVSAVAVYYLVLGEALTAVLMRTVLALLPIGVITAALLMIVLRLGLEESITGALIAATVVAAGWIVGYMTGEWRRVGEEQERRRDIIRAAITELELIADHGRRADWPAAMTEARQNFRKQARYEVFIFYSHQYVTLRRLVEQVEILKWAQIRAVMDVFQALDRLDTMAARMNSEAFKTLPKPRREDGLLRYLRLHQSIPTLADNAVAALRTGPFRGLLKWMN